MGRLLRITVAVAILIALGSSVSPAFGLMIAMRSPAQRAASAEVVVVGKVTAIEKESVEAQPFPNAPNKVSYKVAVVKIETNLAGAANTTHVKIGFVPPAPPAPNAPPGGGARIRPPIRRGPTAPELKVGQEMLFFLTKHPGGNFYVMPAMSPPIEVKGEQGKKDLEAVEWITATIADPMKGLKSEKANVRAETAAILIMKYRTYPEFAAGVDQLPIDAEESRLIVQALADGEWSQKVRPLPTAGGVPSLLQAFYQLGLTDKDGWKQPMAPPPQPGQPPADFAAILKKAYTEWLAGPGKDYRVKKLVARKK